jgi:hypothetical protein
MKLQHIIIIFVIIVVPIALVLSMYINMQIKTINNQTKYDNVLINASYDGIKAFQLNTANNMYSTISNSKIRDIEAAVNVFFNSLATNMGTSGYSKADLQPYIPAIMVNLYDGYYIYSNYYDTEYDGNGDGVKGEYRYGLKPFVYYSCRYKKEGQNTDFVVNYTLDNTITIIGTIKGKYVVKTGHLLLANDDVADEILNENLIILSDDSTENVNPRAESFQYIVYNSQKIYKVNNDAVFASGQNDTGTLGRQRYFYYSSEYKKDFVTNPETIAYLNNHLRYLNGSWNLVSDSATKYYAESLNNDDTYGTTDFEGNKISFTDWVKKYLGDITANDAVDTDGNPIVTDEEDNGSSNVGFASNLGTTKIFDISSTNDPLDSGSAFNEHRRNVIRRSIETNLVSAIATFTSHTVVGYEFTMPKLSEEEWNKIENNVCMVTFLEGIPIGAKVYNNYCVVSNNTNQETVGNDSIYIIDNKGEYHKPGCLRLIDDLKANNVTITGAYASSEFERKTVSITGEDSNAHSQLLGGDVDSGKYAYYYPEAYTPCYSCMVSASQTYSTDDIIKDEVYKVENNQRRKVNITDLGSNHINLRQVYLTALARSRYNLYITNGYFGY